MHNIEKRDLISVVVTIYNEEGNIHPLIDQIETALEGYKFEIIYVDDGSTDQSVKMIKDRKSEFVKLLVLNKNYGQCAALKAGIDFAEGKYIVTMDGDLQNDPKDILRLISYLEDGEFDLVSGIRKKRKDGYVLRLLPSKIANRMIRRLTGVSITDNGCAIKAFRAEIAKSIDLYGDSHRFISILAAFQGAHFSEIEVDHHPRVSGKSKYGISRTFKVLSDLIMLVFFKKYMLKPMHLFGTIGIFQVIIGSGILLYLLIEKMMNHDIGQRPILMLGVLFLIIGLQIIFTGLTFEYLKKIYFGNEKSKSYRVRKVLDF